jgi:hypothetical protein
VNEVNLADLYQAANIPLSAEDFAARESGFAAVCKTLSEAKIIDLTRMYFGFWEKLEGFEWFREGFDKPDAPFSLAANRREASVLAGGILLEALKGGQGFAGLAVLSASLSGLRSAAVPGIEMATFETEFKNLTAKAASSQWYSTSFKPLGKSLITSEKMIAGGSIGTMGPEVQMALDETYSATKAAFGEVQALLKQMANDLSEARQEIEMLWWLTGGCSRKLERPFADLGIPLGAVAAGFDLADLSLTSCGPYAAEAMLARALSGIKKPKRSVSLAEVGDSPSVEEFGFLAVSQYVPKCLDICPLSAALAKSAEIGKGTAWHQSFEKDVHAKPSAQLGPLEIAVQAMRERLLLSNL